MTQTQMQTEILFKDHVNMIRDRAWSFHNTTGLDYDELFSEGLVIFMKAVQAWDGKRKFSTVFYRILNNEFSTFIRKMDACPEMEADTLPARVPNPRQALQWKEKLEHFLTGLSGEARHVAKLVLNGPAEAIGIIGTEPPRVVRGAIHRYLVRDRGVSHQKAWAVLKELREAMS